MAESHDLTLGILFIANVITASLWGVSSLQTYSYFTSYQDDRKWLKGLVFVAWSLDTLHQALIFHADYFYLVTNWGASPPTTRIIWSFQAQIPLNIVLSFTVQSFFVFRIWKLSKQNIVITTPVAVLVIAQLVGYMAFTCKVYANRFSDFSQFALLQDLVVAANIITVTADMSLAFTLTYLLHKSRTGFKSSDGMIKKLIVFTINTGLFASLNVLGALVAFVTSPSTAVYVLFYFIMARLYFNSLMANLNARKIVNGHSLYIESISIGSMRTPNRTSCRRRLLFAREEQPVHGMSVKVDTALEMRGDFNPIESDHRKGVLPIKSQTQ